MNRSNAWAPAPLAIAAVAVAVLAFAAHAWAARSGVYLNYVSGIWLALGYDLAHGTFYRDLIGPLGYGGTRYFPLFFTLIAGLMKIGVPPLPAGWVAAGVSAGLLAAGMGRVARSLGAPKHIVWLAGAGGLAPYFVQQTLFEIRADALAAALNLWGLAAAIEALQSPASARPKIGAAGAWFTLAAAAKITSLAVPGCVFLAMLLAGRFKPAARLAAAVGAGGATFLGLVQLASGGRAIGVWRACMLMETSENETLRSWLSGHFVGLVRYSHLLTAMFALTVTALVALVALHLRRNPAAGADGPGRRIRRLFGADGSMLWLPLALFGGVTASAALTLSSPGTVASNQMVEWLVVTFAVLTMAAAMRVELRRPLSWILVLVVCWMSTQDVIRAGQLWQERAGHTRPEVRRQIAAVVGKAPTPVLSESALWPTLGGRHSFVLDPFALRVAMRSRPDIARDLATRIEDRYFSSVIFQVDPASERGRGYYENVNFGWPITSLILANYRFDSRPARDVWVYLPKETDAR